MLDAWVWFASRQSKDVAVARRPPPGEPPFVLITIEMTSSGLSYFTSNGQLTRGWRGTSWNFKGDLAALCQDESGHCLYSVLTKPCQLPTLVFEP
jgi:hypothetical protein